MKKIYFLGLALAGLMTANAQEVFQDDFESYPIGSYFGGHWSNWTQDPTATELHIIVADDQSVSGAKSGYVGSDGVQDPVLLLGLRDAGVWTIQFQMYVDFGSTGYFNIQQTLANMGVEGNWANQFYFGVEPIAAPAETPGVGYVTGTEFYYEFAYPEEQWFPVKLEIDLGAGTLKMWINGTEVVPIDGSTIPYGGDQFLMEAMNFYSHSEFSTNSYFIDDVIFAQGQLGVNDVNATSSISVYPTLANEVINVTAKSNISEVSVYNMNGQQVAKVAGNGTSAQVNVSALPAGTYVVKTVAGKEVKSTKVVVK